MKNYILAALLILVFAAACIHSQAAALAAPQQAPAAAQPGASAADQAAAAANAAQRQQIQQELQSLQQRLTARYAGDLSPEQIQQRIQQLQQQLQRLGPAPAGGGRGFGAGRGGRGGPIAPPADATPEQLRQIIDRQNQQITGLQAAARPPARPAAPQPCVPVNPNAMQEAKDLLKKICDVTGKGILTGQHNFPNHRNADTEAIHTATGNYPAIWGSDFGFLDGEDKDAITHRDLLIEEAKRQHAAGSIIYFWAPLRRV
jgi:TolA-binding protein